MVCDETFEVRGYDGASAHLQIWRSAEPFDDPSQRFRRSGLVIKGGRAIHECSLLSPEFEKDPLGKRFFGRLECPFIDQLLKEYDDRRESGEMQLDENPSLLIDPNRQQGLKRQHPFTTALFLVPSERLRALVAQDRDAEKAQKKTVANQETTTRLDKLARRASDFLRDRVEDIEDTGAPDDDVDKSAFARQGVLIYPTYLRVAVDHERILTYYVKRDLIGSEDSKVRVDCDDEAIEVLEPEVSLKTHKLHGDRLQGTFCVRGRCPKEAVVIRATCEGVSPAEAIAEVLEGQISEHMFNEPLEFEHGTYRVREGSRRTLQLFAKYPEVVSQVSAVSLQSSDSVGLAVRGQCQLEPVAGSNYASGVVTVQGRRLHSKSVITASVNGRTATAEVKVVQKKDNDPGVTIKIELRDEDYGNFRAKWADQEGKPHLLLVSAKHRSLARYLGPAPDHQGQNSPLFRVLLAELIADSVCRKALALESRERPWEFDWADLTDNTVIADTVFANYQQRFRDFVADAHRIMVNDSEVRNLST